MDDLKAVFHNPHSHELLAVVTAVHHEGVDQPFDNRALSLAETLSGIPSRAVGKVFGGLLLDGDVVLQN